MGNMELQAEGPRYLRIARELRQNIEQGVYKAGDQVPTEAALAERFGVNRHTLRRAISLLASEGLLRVDQGRGTFVADIAPVAAVRYPIGDRVRFSETLRAQGMEPRYETLRAIALPAPARVASQAEVGVGESVVLLERLGLANGRPLKVASSYFPVARFPDILDRLRETASISRLFADVYGCDHRRRSTVVTAQAVSPEDARLLGVAYNSPVLVAEAVNTDEAGRVIEYGVTRFRADRTELVIEGHL
jgi:GntR family transcriptional regulator, phosphonate transport system regulatory protein